MKKDTKSSAAPVSKYEYWKVYGELSQYSVWLRAEWPGDRGSWIRFIFNHLVSDLENF
jgi:hypothetical protein